MTMLSSPEASVALNRTLVRLAQLRVSEVAVDRLANVAVSVPPPERVPRSVIETVGVDESVIGPTSRLFKVNGAEPLSVIRLPPANPKKSVVSPGKSVTAAESNTAELAFVGVSVKPASAYGAAGFTLITFPVGATFSNVMVSAEAAVPGSTRRMLSDQNSRILI